MRSVLLIGVISILACGLVFASTPQAGQKFLPTVSNSEKPKVKAPNDMVWIPGGTFSMGAARPKGHLDHVGMNQLSDALPVHQVYVDGFWMDRTEVTNEKFEQFIQETKYQTIAEQKPKSEDFPGVPPKDLKAGSAVFKKPNKKVELNNSYQWWTFLHGANWRKPLGPGSNLKGKEKYPVVHVAYPDAEKYCNWAKKRLPTEAEFEFAARGGLSGQVYPWGNEFPGPKKKHMANTFQGSFPNDDQGKDGFSGIAPVAQYEPNGYGLYDMAGNVWEWASDWYRPNTYQMYASQGKITKNPKGPPSSYDPQEPQFPKRVHRGGSYLCTDQYCSRYMVGTRGKGEISTGTNHLGFRCVKAGK